MSRKPEDIVIEVSVSSSARESVLSMLQYIGWLSRIGHSFGIEVDPDNSEYKKTFGLDGDGGAYITDIQIDGKDHTKWVKKGEQPMSDDIVKGDKPGHEFHGNQYTGASGEPDLRHPNDLRNEAESARTSANIRRDEGDERMAKHFEDSAKKLEDQATEREKGKEGKDYDAELKHPGNKFPTKSTTYSLSKPTAVYMDTGKTVGSNRYYGNAQVLNSVYERKVVPAGTSFVHDNTGSKMDGKRVWFNKPINQSDGKNRYSYTRALIPKHAVETSRDSYKANWCPAIGYGLLIPAEMIEKAAEEKPLSTLATETQGTDGKRDEPINYNSKEFYDYSDEALVFPRQDQPPAERITNTGGKVKSWKAADGYYMLNLEDKEGNRVEDYRYANQREARDNAINLLTKAARVEMMKAQRNAINNA